MRLFHRHAQDVVDGLALVADLQRLAVVALAVADVTGHEDVRQEVHFHLDQAVALAGLAAAALDVEGEAPRPVAAVARLRHAGEEFSDRRQQARVGSGVGTRRASDRRLVDADHLVEELQSFDRVVRRRLGAAAVKVARGGGVERVVDERRLAGAGYAGDAGEQPHWQVDGDLLQVVAACAEDAQLPRRIRRLAFLRQGNGAASGEVGAGERIRVGGDLLRRAFRDDATAVLAGARAHVNHMVGGMDGFLVVLDDDHRVAEVAQLGQRGEQARVVALVQADRGLVQHVHDAGEAGADLAGQADALRLAAGERFRRAVERKIVEADIDEEGQARGDLPHDLLRHLGTLAFHCEQVEEVARGDQGQGAELRQVAPADEDVARLAAQARALAIRAGPRVEVFRQFLAHGDGVRLLVAALEVVDDALEGMFLDAAASRFRQVAEGDFLAAGAVEDNLALVFRQRLEGLLDVEAAVRGEACQQLEIELVAPVPAADSAGGERQVRIGDDARRIEEADVAEAIALRAGAHRVVEGEQARLQFLQRVAAHRAGEAGREEVLTAGIHLHRHGAAVGVDQRRLEGFGQALARVGAYLEAIHHHVDGVLAVLRQLRQGVDVVHLAVHAQPHEALRAQLGEQVMLFALAAGHDWGEDHQLGVFGQLQHVVHHLRDALRRERLAVLRAVRRAGTGEEQAQVVVDLGDGADRRARVVAGGLLLDGDGRRETLDEVDIRLLHQLQELPRVGREGLHVAALAFGVERVEGQRGLAGTGQAGDHRQSVARQVEVQVLQVVRPRAADADFFHGWR